MAADDDDKPMPRRRFFREGLFELFKPLARSVEPLQRVAEQIGAMDQPVLPPPPVRHWLRPPGSLQESQFRDQCSRCSECVRVCPSHCIKIDFAGDKGEGAPYINPDESACVMCTTLACMHNCTSGALQSTLIDFIDMGVSVWNESTCLRSNGQQECTICVDICPVGARAITLEDTRINVREGFTGCGSCQHACPTSPKSITILPKSAR